MRVAPALVALVALTLGGCLFAADDGLSDRDAPPARACHDAARHCNTKLGEVCRKPDGSGSPQALPGEEERFDGICVIPAARSVREVFVEVRPEVTTGLPTMQLGPVSLAAGQNQELRLPEPARVSGTVLFAGMTPEQRVERAQVRFRSRPLIPGRPLSVDAETLSDPLPSRSGTFERVLAPGAYTITVQAPDLDETRAPPERPFGDGYIEVESGQRPFQFEVSSRSDLIRLSGQVLVRTAEGLVPAEAIEVWAMDARGMADKLVVSRQLLGTSLAQPVRTGRDGRFVLWLPRRPREGAHELRLQFGPAPDAAQPFPSFRLDQVFQVSESQELDAPIVLEGIGGRRDVTGVVLDMDGLPVPGATVTFGTLDTEPFDFRASVQTGPDGAFRVQLYPGTYGAIAQPRKALETPNHPTLPLGLCPLGGELRVPADDPNDLSVQFTCEQRRVLFGRVLVPSMPGEGAPHVVVEAVRRADGLVPALVREQTTTDATGQFLLALSPGIYDLTLRPAPSLKLPYKTVRGVDADQPGLVVVELDRPFELFGQLVDAAGRPVPGTVEAYAVDETGAASLVGRGLSAADGSYALVLPTSSE